MAFADKLKELLNQRNMKAIDLARSTGLSEAAISDYINRKRAERPAEHRNSESFKRVS